MVRKKLGGATNRSAASPSTESVDSRKHGRVRRNKFPFLNRKNSKTASVSISSTTSEEDEQKDTAEIIPISESAFMPLSLSQSVNETFSESIDLFHLGVFNNSNCKQSQQHRIYVPHPADSAEMTEDAEICLAAIEFLQKAHSGSDHIKIARLYVKLGGIYSKRTEYGEAIASFLKARSIFSAMLGDDQPEVISTRVLLGKAYQAKGKYDTALSEFMMVRRMRTAVLGRDHVLVGEALVDLGVVNWDKGKVEFALRYMKRALRIFRNVPNGYPNIAMTLDSVGTLHYMLGNYNKAMIDFSEAFKERVAMHGRIHPDVGLTLVKVGLVLKQTNNISKSLHVMLKALDIQRKSLGERHHHVAATLDHLGDIYVHQNKLNNAVHTYKLAVHTLKDDPSRMSHVAEILVKVGSAYKKIDEPAKALYYSEKALGMYKKLYGDKHLSVATVLNAIGKIYYSNGEKDLAIKAFNNVLTVRQAVLGKHHPLIADSKNIVAIVYWSKGELGEATRYFSQALSLSKAVHGERHIKVASMLCNLGVIFEEQGQKNEALESFRESLHIFRSYQGIELLSRSRKYDSKNGESSENTIDYTILNLETVIRNLENGSERDESVGNFSALIDAVNGICLLPQTLA